MFDNKKHQVIKVITEHPNALRELVEDGAETVHIDWTYPHDYVKEVYEAKESGHVRGKIVIEIM